MSYCTLQDLIDEFGEDELIRLTDRVGAGVVDQTVVDRATARADRTINRYLVRANLPLASDDVVDLACDIARFFLYDDQPTTTVSDRYDRAIEQLKAMARGDVGLASTTGASTSVINTPDYIAPDRTFTDDTLTDYTDPYGFF